MLVTGHVTITVTLPDTAVKILTNPPITGPDATQRVGSTTNSPLRSTDALLHNLFFSCFPRLPFLPFLVRI